MSVTNDSAELSGASAGVPLFAECVNMRSEDCTVEEEITDIRMIFGTGNKVVPGCCKDTGPLQLIE